MMTMGHCSTVMTVKSRCSTFRVTTDGIRRHLSSEGASDTTNDLSACVNSAARATHVRPTSVLQPMPCYT